MIAAGCPRRGRPRQPRLLFTERKGGPTRTLPGRESPSPTLCAYGHPSTQEPSTGRKRCGASSSTTGPGSPIRGHRLAADRLAVRPAGGDRAEPFSPSIARSPSQRSKAQKWRSRSSARLRVIWIARTSQRGVPWLRRSIVPFSDGSRRAGCGSSTCRCSSVLGLPSRPPLSDRLMLCSLTGRKTDWS